MSKDDKFSRDGKEYKIKEDNVQYVAKNKSRCIKKEGENAIEIDKAIEKSLIEATGQAPTEATGQLFDLTSEPLKTSLYDNNENYKKPSDIDNGSNDHVEREHKPESIPKQNTGIPIKINNFLYMPVDELRAQVFLAHGLIYPSIYDDANLDSKFNDIQQQFPAYLTLFETRPHIKDRQLLLRVLLSPEEIKMTHKEGEMLLLELPLPISRLDGIEVPLNSADLDTYIRGWINPDVPVPKHLFSKNKAPQTKESYCKQDSTNIQASSQPNSEYIESISKFNRYLGVMANLRNIDRYFSKKTKKYADYPEIFFALYSQIIGKPFPHKQETPDLFFSTLLDLKGEDEVHPSNKIIFDLVRSSESYIDKDKFYKRAQEIYQKTGNIKLLGEAFKNLFDGDYRSAIIKLQKPEIPKEASILAMLYKFSNRLSRDDRNVKQQIHNDWQNSYRVQLALATLGAYYGYAIMDAKETRLYSVHPYVQPYIEKYPCIKFKLTTIFERKLIEALYQHAFFPNKPFDDSGDMFDMFGSILTVPTSKEKPHKMKITDSSYSVDDLFVQKYEVTRLGEIVQKLQGLGNKSINEKSEIGKYLMSQCFFYGNSYELSKHNEQHTLRYQILIETVIELILEEKITVNPQVLEAALYQDNNGYLNDA